MPFASGCRRDDPNLEANSFGKKYLGKYKGNRRLGKSCRNTMKRDSASQHGMVSRRFGFVNDTVLGSAKLSTSSKRSAG
jgi:hypothetical protein